MPEDEAAPLDEPFTDAYTMVRASEGGYVDHPDDPGGATLWGVTQRTYDFWRRQHELPRQAVRGMTESECWAIYRTLWRANQCDAMPRPVALVHFDAVVNHGSGTATKLIQRIVGVTPDGLMGPATLQAILAACAAGRPVAREYLAARRRFYGRLVVRRPRSVVFLRGWWRRLKAVAAAGVASLVP